jgi:hypothetical protein
MTYPDPGFDDVSDRLENTPFGFGRLTAVRHAVQLGNACARVAIERSGLGRGYPLR